MAAKKRAQKPSPEITEFAKRWSRAHEISTKLQLLARENDQLNDEERRAIDRLGSYLALAAAGLVDAAAYPVILSAAKAVVGNEISRVRVLNEVRDALKAACDYAGDPVAGTSPAGWLMARLKSLRLPHRAGASIDRGALAEKLRAPGKGGVVAVTAWISAELGLFDDVADPLEVAEHKRLKRISGKYESALRAVKERAGARQLPVSY